MAPKRKTRDRAPATAPRLGHEESAARRDLLAAAAPATAPLIRLRPYQEEDFRHPSGRFCRLYRRQSGKSYGLANEAIDWMMETPGCSVFFASASINLGTENIRKEAEVWAEVTAKLRRAIAATGGKITTTADDDSGELLDPDAVADLFEHGKLETRLWHSNSVYSRSKVVAPNPATAVGWTGYVILDEIGRIILLKDLLESMGPIFSADSRFKMRWATTPPPDDNHHSYELLAPPADAQFPINPRGNWYRSAAGILVHRVDAWDGFAAGVPLYDEETREPLTPEQHRERSLDKEAWDRNYALKFTKGGVAAVSLTALHHSQAAGAGLGCTGIQITEELKLAA